MNTSAAPKIRRILPAALVLALAAPLPAMADGFSDCLERLRAQAARRGQAPPNPSTRVT